MPRIVIVGADGEGREHELSEGTPLMEPLRELGLVDAVCGGGVSCGTCVVSIDAAWRARLPDAQVDELALLDGLGCEPGAQRLSCQVLVSRELDGIVVRAASHCG
ncbi:2Fe-2S iron-sulfur cluster-binding protein [Solimonas soli]|uniref:2Fe-2S iron-sulfur cluster-binding protein n=1 Tax=Solimonas soli TaxID=413479 RepID=UPI0004856286|nr:2Fe-2S iron-sulfur cluster-binding protein [Solimonas soli]